MVINSSIVKSHNVGQVSGEQGASTYNAPGHAYSLGITTAF